MYQRLARLPALLAALASLALLPAQAQVQVAKDTTTVEPMPPYHPSTAGSDPTGEKAMHRLMDSLARADGRDTMVWPTEAQREARAAADRRAADSTVAARHLHSITATSARGRALVKDCAMLVRGRLRAPSTARFDARPLVGVDDSTVMVSWGLDAMNGYGGYQHLDVICSKPLHALIFEYSGLQMVGIP